jgi:hypothetical protein
MNTHIFFSINNCKMGVMKINKYEKLIENFIFIECL